MPYSCFLDKSIVLKKIILSKKGVTFDAFIELIKVNFKIAFNYSLKGLDNCFGVYSLNLKKIDSAWENKHLRQ